VFPDAKSLYESFLHGVKASGGDSPFLGTRSVLADKTAGEFSFL
jgi:hypothetical protein